MTGAIANFVLPLLLATSTDAAAPAAGIHMDADTVRADAGGSWSIPFTLHNPGTMGLYGDSLFVDITDLDPGVSRAPRHSTTNMGFWIQRAGTVGGGEDKTMQLTVAAPCERAMLTLRLFLHDGGGHAYAFRESLPAEPSALTAAMPSRFLTLKGKRVEFVTATSAAAGLSPGVLLVPSENAHARRLARLASQLAARGMNVVAVSPPGYGQSDGPADMAGPATLLALEAALEKLGTLPGTDRHRLAVWGTGRGATAALLLAARHPEIGRVVAQEAGYDLRSSLQAADPAMAAEIRLEAGPDSSGWKARSPLFVAARIPANVLVIHGANPGSPLESARAFVAARQAARLAVDTLWAAPGTRRLRKDPVRAGIEFLSPAAAH